jgi:hypothetical protein
MSLKKSSTVKDNRKHLLVVIRPPHLMKAKKAADEESENPSVNRDNILETKVETEECKPIKII